MILVVRHLADPVSDALACLLGPRLRSLYIEGWLAGCTVVHTVGPAGVTTRMSDRGGGILLDDTTAVVLNRVAHVAAPAFLQAPPGDSDYATVEATAAFWSCLEGLCCPLLNAPAALRMAGTGAELGAAGHAAAAGLHTRLMRMTTRSRRDESPTIQPFAGAGIVPVGAPGVMRLPNSGECGTLWVVGDKVLGDLDGVDGAAALSFARRIGLGFGTLQFVRSPTRQWSWTGFDALPAPAPAAVLDALAGYLLGHEMAADVEEAS